MNFSSQSSGLLRLALMLPATVIVAAMAGQAHAICGDDVCNFGETCGTCATDCCPLPPVPCGDGVCQDGQETCSTCHFDCCPAGTCGDGELNGSESCDDGNTVDGDGCSSGCVFEQTLICQASSNGQHAVWLRADDIDSTTGSEVTSWNNVARPSAFVTTGGSVGGPLWIDGALNQHATVRFSAPSLLADVSQWAGFDDHAIIAVVVPQSSAVNSTLVSPLSGTEHRLELTPGSPISANYHDATTPAAGLTPNQPHIVAARVDITAFALDLLIQAQLFVDGVGAVPSSTIATGYAWSLDPGMLLGNTAMGTAGLNGDVAEFIVFKRELNDAELDAVQTYLAIKYGITLPADHYRATNGTPLAQSNTSNPLAMAGVGRQVCNGLDQQVSSSVVDPTITVDASEAALADGQYLLWGTDAMTTTTQALVSELGCAGERISRTYRFSNAGPGGPVGAVRVVVDLSPYGIDLGNLDAVRLLVASNTNFASGATDYLGTALGGGRFEFTGVVPTDGSYFTVFACPNATCGNALVEGGEGCDDGGTTNGDGCSSACVREVELLCGGPHRLWFRPAELFGPTATDWNDIGGAHDLEVVVGLSAPQVTSDLINGYKSIAPASSSTQGLGNPNFPGALTGHTVMMAVRPLAAGGATRTLIASADMSHALNYDGTQATYATESAPLTPGQLHLLTAAVTTAGPATGPTVNYELFVDGLSDGPTPQTWSTPYRWGTTDGLYVGNDAAGTSPFGGDIAEVLAFDRPLTAAEQEIVQTYLAIKFGVTLPFDGYRGTNGAALYGLDSHPQHITGVGRADCQQLAHVQSVSTDGLLTLSADALADGSYVLVGADGGASAGVPSTLLGNCNEHRLERTFRVATSDAGPQTVRLQFATAEITSATFATGQVRLLIDADGDFTSGAQVVAPTGTGTGIHIFDNVLVDHGHHLALVAYHSSPVASDLSDNVTSSGWNITSIAGAYTTDNGALPSPDSGPTSKGYFIVVQPSDAIYYSTTEWSGSDTVDFEVCNNYGCCDSATLTLYIDVNTPPTAADDSALVNEDASGLIAVLDNDSDAEGQVMVPVITVDPASGTATPQPSGTVLYVPSPGFYGQDSFQYEACDSEGACSLPVVVTIEVNGSPFAGPDGAVVQQGNTVIIDVSPNDSDPEDDVMSWASAPGTELGTAVHIGGSQFSYTAPVAYDGPDSFNYALCDEHGACSVGTVSILVDDTPNQAPVATDDLVTTAEEAPINVSALANDGDPDMGDVISITQLTAVPPVSEGIATFSPSGTITFVPAVGFVGVATLTYEVCDDKSPALCDQADVEVTVTTGFCGDGACSAGNNCNNCLADCGICTCGNGAIEPGEECDDSNQTPYDGCDENCQHYQVLGDDREGVFWVRADWIQGPSGELQFWDAIGTNLDLAALDSGTPPWFDLVDAPKYFNGHPAVNADPTTRNGLLNKDVSAADGHTTFVVDMRWTDDGGTSVIADDATAYRSYLWSRGTAKNWRYKGATVPTPLMAVNGEPRLTAMTAEVSSPGIETVQLHENGNPGELTTAVGLGEWPGGIVVADWTDGSGNPAGRWHGDVAEVVLYPGTLSKPERQMVETYLGVKYGLTLPADGYRALDGTPLYGNSAHAEAIAGIGRQDTQGLLQLSSRAFGMQWVQLSAPSIGSSDSYALMGADVLTSDWTQSPWATYDNASQAVYHLVNNGPGGDVDNLQLTVSIPTAVGGLGAATVYLVMDNNSSFSSPTAVAATISGRDATFSNLTISTGTYLRFAIVQPALCSDGSQNGNETDIDCGGNCPACADGDSCTMDTDCTNGVCTSGTCQSPTCSDGVQNGDETDVDCGGTVCVYCGCVLYMPGGEMNTCNGLDEDCDGETDEEYDDGLACTLSYCSGGVAQNLPSNLACNDNNGCTQDLCSVGAGGCLNINDNSGTPNVIADDGNQCTDLRCVAGASVNVVDDTNIPNDGLFCTTQTCSGGTTQTSVNSGFCLVNDECIADGQASTKAPCGVCDTSVSQTELQDHALEMDFETLNGWTTAMLYGGTTGVQWQPTTYRASEGSHSFYFGEYESGVGYNYDEGERVAGTLTSPSFMVPNTVVNLDFEYYMEVEEVPPYDTLHLEINVGMGWVELWSTANSTPEFEAVSLDLGPYVGQTAQIRFRFDTVDSWANNFEGAFVDNLKISAACCFVQSDCDDGDACTVDVCGSNQGCYQVNTCSAGCGTGKNILLVFDYSGSMDKDDGSGSSTKWGSAVAGLDAAMQQFEPLMNTSLLLFPSQSEGGCGMAPVPSPASALWASTPPPAARAPEFWFGVSRTELIGFLSAQTPDGSTPMAAGIRRAKEVYMSGHPTINPGKQFVILVSDGSESCDTDYTDGTGSPADAVQELYDANIETFVIGFGAGIDQAMLTQAAINGGHAKSVGEAFYSASNEGEMAQAMGEILLALTGEECNNMDDDCNGLVDDGVPDEPCVAMCNGQPYPGVSACVGGMFGSCQLPSIAEVCDGIDNDCDGETDEGFSLGGSCSVGVGACQNTGEVVCNAEGTATICSALPGTPTTEICDGIDNDCTGAADEVFPTLGLLCDGDDTDLCQMGTWTCVADGSGVECVNETASFVEICDGDDETCDGLIDEGFNVGANCDGADGDVCLEGQFVCDTLTGGVTCSDVGGTNDEMCNNFDDDCDGKTDEGYDVGVPCDGPDTDFCKRGTKTCSLDGTGTICVDDAPNGDEICNGLDDDCDGAIDEPDSIGCIVFYEDKDDDGYGIGDGLCLCSPQGHLTATDNGDCDDEAGDIYPGAVELCDGRDQDCDLVVDEDPETDAVPWMADCYSGATATTGVGICAGGQTACLGAAGFDPVCGGEQLPEMETCDGLDNDCDGETDEQDAVGCTFFWQDVDNDTFGTGPSRCLCAAEGEWDVPGGDLDCDDTNGDINPNADEICDGVDNDCDDTIDQNLADGSPLTEPCYTGPAGTEGVGTCMAGTRACDANLGEFGVCDGEVIPTAQEVCDGLDSDCDGFGDDMEPDDDSGQSHPCSTVDSCTGLVCYCLQADVDPTKWSCVTD